MRPTVEEQEEEEVTKLMEESSRKIWDKAEPGNALKAEGRELGGVQAN